ncbi:MAG TPA: hypothetical protein PK812_12220, partial [Beijerinckiaceae bacterium]|nr:hypothetical protein [Beijerinckiaceae bacterium]
MSLPRIRLDFGLSKLIPGAQKAAPEPIPSNAIAFPLAGAAPFDGYPNHISETAPANLPGWTISGLHRRIPADLAALLSPDPASALRTVTALVDRLDYYRARMAEYQERLSTGAKGSASIENYIRLVYIQLFNELATAFRLDLTQDGIADVRAQAFVRVIRQVKLLTTADLIKVADLIQDEVLNAIIARSDWIRRGEDGPVAASQPTAPMAPVPARP